MRALIQRVKSASVSVDGAEPHVLGGPGIVLFLGITHDDCAADAETLAEKCMNLRIFQDEQGKMNLSLLQTHKRAMIVSQFTLYGDTRKGRRPAFVDAALPEKAIVLYNHFINCARALGVAVVTGEFGADMLVDLQNDGPVTLMVEYPIVKA